MAENWPATVNQDVLRSGYSEEPRDNTFTFEPEAGPPIGMSRTIMQTAVRQFDQWLTQAEYEALDAWRRDTLADGTLAFTRIDPLRGDVGTFVFMQGGFRLTEILPIERRVSFKLMRIV